MFVRLIEVNESALLMLRPSKFHCLRRRVRVGTQLLTHVTFPNSSISTNSGTRSLNTDTEVGLIVAAVGQFKMDTDLVTWARDAAAKGDDLFTLLSIDATASESEIRSAYRRKALGAHPDKAGDAYDPALFERLGFARDALINPEARKAYDDGMRAILQKRAQLDQMSTRRRRLVEELEQREEAAKRVKTEAHRAERGKPDPERDAMLARGRAKAKERKRLMREAEERERLAQEQEIRKEKKCPPTETPTMEGAAAPDASADSYDARIAEIERQIEKKRQRKREKMMAIKGGAGAEDAKQTSKSPPHPSTGTAEADACKQPPPAETAAVEPVQNSSSNKFAATLARLKAAQVKRDEEKRKKAEEEAKAST